MARFVPGLQLARDFYRDVVAPAVPISHAAGLLGSGSDVLGFDTERSTDHDWGPRCIVFVNEAHVSDVRCRVMAALPNTYQGWPVRVARDGRPPEPGVLVEALAAWLNGQIGWDLGDRELTAIDWLLIPQQRLLGITRGAVFADPDGELARMRERLSWYPDAVWWWLLASQWRRLAQEEPFVQRTTEVDDHVGSLVVANRLLRDCMRLALLLSRTYAPYGKWLGTAFGRLPDPDGLAIRLAEGGSGTTPFDREEALGRAYQLLGERFNNLPIGTRLDTSLRPFHDRPARVLDADRFTAAALSQVSDPALRRLPLIGSVDQLLDSTDALSDPRLTSRLRCYYEAVARPA